MTHSKTTLRDFLDHNGLIGFTTKHGLDDVIWAISAAVKTIAHQLDRGEFAQLLGDSGPRNVFGEKIKNIDALADRAFSQFLAESRQVSFVFSEEKETPLSLVPKAANLVFVDPFDGSSLVDANAATGSIFSVFQRENGGPYPAEARLVNLRHQICAGYGLYGPATLLVLAFGDGVYEFVLQKGTGEFVLSGEKLTLPAQGQKTYSVNEGYSYDWPRELVGAIGLMKRSGYSLRYAGALVADFHRIFKQGGVFMYPATRKNPEGKLRLFYEVAPLAYVIERAGGFAMADRPDRSILDLRPAGFNQRTPFMFGHPRELEIIKTLWALWG